MCVSVLFWSVKSYLHQCFVRLNVCIRSKERSLHVAHAAACQRWLLGRLLGLCALSFHPVMEWQRPHVDCVQVLRTGPGPCTGAHLLLWYGKVLSLFPFFSVGSLGSPAQPLSIFVSAVFPWGVASVPERLLLCHPRHRFCSIFLLISMMDWLVVSPSSFIYWSCD